MQPVDIPVNDIKIINRLRKTDEGKVEEISQSIETIGLLHPIQVAKKEDKFILLSGSHRLGAYKLLQRPTIPAVVRDNDELINKLVEISENLCSKKLNAIQEAQNIVLREQILIKLGKKSVVGSNQYQGQGITNAQLANQLGVSRRIYSYKKQVANLLPDVQEILGESKFAEQMMYMVKLSKQPEDIQREVARILSSGETTTFNRALIMANLKLRNKEWKSEYVTTRDEVETPKSVMRFDRKSDKLNDICMMVSHDENLRKKKCSSNFGLSQLNNYTMLPEHSRWFVKYYSKEGELVCDNTCGRGTNILAAAYENRRVIGYDLNKDNLASIENALVNHIGIERDKFTLHHSCGIEMDEYKQASNQVDLFLNDIPYIMGAEKYTDDPRDLCNVKDLDQFYNRVEVMLRNMKRLVKTSDFEKKIYKPIIMKVGSQRRGKQGLYRMDSEIEMIGRRVGLTLHDSITNELKPTLQYLQQCIANKITVKCHETSLVFLKYEV